MFVERNKISEESGSRTTHPVVFLEKMLDTEEKLQRILLLNHRVIPYTVTDITCVKYRMEKQGTDNCTGIFNFFLRREIPYTNTDSVV